jgi:peptidoglycan hydrolase-like protein with peptidoglycan-binding domain
MELFGFVEVAVIYEDPTPAPEVKLFDGAGWHLPSSAWISLTSVAVVLSVVSVAPEKAAAATTVSHGSNGTEVVAVQKALGIEADGQFGAKTEAAVKDFQIRQGLKQVDGIVGKETATALGLDEKYRPVSYGFTDTFYGAGQNIRSGPGLDYRIIGGSPEGALLNVEYEDIEYADGYAWVPAEDGGWVAANYVDYQSEFRPVGDFDEPYYYNGDDTGDVSDEPSYVPTGAEYGFVDTRSGVGLNVRSCPSTDCDIVGGEGEGSFVVGDGTYYSEGYAWVQLEDGNWVASDYLN